MNRIRNINLITLALWLLIAAPAFAQEAANPAPLPPPALDDITISPSRLELVMPPGTEKTVLVNLIYTSVSGKAEPTRVIAYLGDWTLLVEGRLLFAPAGSRADSASPWMIFSPAEATLEPGRAHSIRVTISVPKDATPGDHLAALFVEPRGDNLKTMQNRRQVHLKFRLAAMFYIMVPNLTRNPSLESLSAQVTGKGVVVTPRLRNDGNSHVRPSYSVKVIDQNGATVAEVPESESLPVLANSSMELPVVIDKVIPAGKYTVAYRVSFDGRGEVTEGQTSLIVDDQLARKENGAPAAQAQPVKQNAPAGKKY